MPASNAASLRIVATFSIVEDWVRAVGGDDVEVISMVPAGNDIHLFEPSPGDFRKMTEADAIFAIGIGLETWLPGIHRTGNLKGGIIYLGETVPLLSREGGEAPHHHAHGAHCDHGDMDPHVWLDPQRVKIMVQHIEAMLTRLAPEKKDAFAARSHSYQESLEQLDAWIREQVNTIPPTQRLLVTQHDNMHYFADRYGFEIKGNILNSFTTEAADPSAQQFVSLIRTIRDNLIPGIFIDANTNPRLAQQLARETGLPPPSKLHSDSLGPHGTPPASYLDLMRENVAVIVRTLAPATL